MTGCTGVRCDGDTNCIAHQVNGIMRTRKETGWNQDARRDQGRMQGHGEVGRQRLRATLHFPLHPCTPAPNVISLCLGSPDQGSTLTHPDLLLHCPAMPSIAAILLDLYLS